MHDKDEQRADSGNEMKCYRRIGYDETHFQII